MARMGFNIKPMQKKGSRGGKERRGEKGGRKTGKREREREIAEFCNSAMPETSYIHGFLFLKV